MSALNATYLKPCHPIPGLYTDAATKRWTYLVDDFGHAVHVFSTPNLGSQWIRHLDTMIGEY